MSCLHNTVVLQNALVAYIINKNETSELPYGLKWFTEDLFFIYYIPMFSNIPFKKMLFRILLIDDNLQTLEGIT